MNAPIAGPLDSGLTGWYAAGVPVVDGGGSFNGRCFGHGFSLNRSFLVAGLEEEGGEGKGDEAFYLHGLLLGFGLRQSSKYCFGQLLHVNRTLFGN